ncbi:MAG: glycosyltransferase family 4 protein [Anaerolineae bacterium]|nr:glycosyltransferase family 4 protein [Anaerolineae bacterium]
MTGQQVLHLRQGSHIWGPEQQILRLAANLPAEGFSVNIAVLCRAEHAEQNKCGSDDLHPLVARARAHGWEAEEWDAGWGAIPRMVGALAQRLRSGGFALLHTHEYKSSILGGWAARQARVPWIASDHGLFTRGSWPKRFYRILETLALRGAAAILVPSGFQRQKLLATGISPERVVVVPHGLDAASFLSHAGSRDETRRALGLAGDEPVLLAVGRLELVKGHHYLLQALPTLLATYPRLRLWMAGEGSLRARLAQQAATLGVAGSVDFLGYRDDVPSLLAACDLVAVPSLEESFGMVVLEALAAARPVVATRVGGVPEVMADRGNGWLIPPADPGALAAAIHEALSYPEEAARRAQAGARRAHERFRASTMTESIAQLYRRVLNEGS